MIFILKIYIKNKNMKNFYFDKQFKDLIKELSHLKPINDNDSLLDKNI